MRVLIVDDLFVYMMRRFNGIASFEEFMENADAGKTKFELKLQYLNETKNPEVFDLTEMYQQSSKSPYSSGGMSDVKLFVLGEPVCVEEWLSLNERVSKQLILARTIFNEQRALRIIEEVNPDVLLLSMDFIAPLSSVVLEEFLTTEKENYQFCIKSDSMIKNIRFQNSLSFDGSLANLYDSIQKFGGLLFAHTLKKVGKTFSFWSERGYHSLKYAYALGMISEEEVRQVVAGHDKASYVMNLQSLMQSTYPEYYENVKKHNQGYQLAALKAPLPHSKNGKVIFNPSHHGMLFEEESKSFNPTYLYLLDDAIRIAAKHQMK